MPEATTAREILSPDIDDKTSRSTTFDPNATLPCPTFRSGRPETGGRPRGNREGRLFSTETLSRRYRVLGTLGRGGMGVVYRAEDSRLGRQVAIKTVPAALVASRRARERFLHEAQTASGLDHPNICTVYEVEETSEGQIFLTMPCYDGETLKSRLKRGPLSLAETLRISQQVARGLAKAHSRGIVHCDIKPANLMVTGDGIVKILDFGISRLTRSAPESSQGPTGTPGYRSPEQARGRRVEASSDVWSLGIVVVEALTGHAPPSDEQGVASAWDESAAALELPPQAPAALAEILARALASYPADRYPHAAALRADLDGLQARLKDLEAQRRALRQTLRFFSRLIGIDSWPFA